ncbi:MAG: glycosyltransferase family 9 protein, partial [Longimicrobiales bacterium]
MTEPFATERLSRKARVAFGIATAAGRVYWAARVLARQLKGRRPASIRRILVARRARLGDTVVLLPALVALRARYPQAYIVLAVQPGSPAASIVEAERCVDEVRVVDFLLRPTLAARVLGAIRLWLEGFDALVTGTSTFLLREVFYCGALYRAGADDGHPLHRLLNRRHPFDAGRHEAETNLETVALLGARAVGAVRVPRIACVPGSQRVDDALRAAVGIPVHASLVIAHAGAQKPSRRWPAAHFALLIERILRTRPDVHVALSGVGDERDVVDAVCAALPADVRDRAHDLVGRTDLNGLTALARGCSAFIVNDTGIMHLVRAAGAPLVALLGPENPLRWGPHPWGGAPAVSLRVRVPCAPCKRWSCAFHACMTCLTVDDVAEEVFALLDTTRPAGAGTDAAEALHGLRVRETALTWSQVAETRLPPLVSIVVPAGDGLDERLDAVRRQDYPRIEAVVVERGQTASYTGRLPGVGALRVVRAGPADDV